MKYVYVILSSTPTLIGKTLRLLSGRKLNHASISLDEDLNEMYSFARLRINTPLVGGFVKENYGRISCGGKFNVFVKIYKIPLSEYQYENVAKYVYSIRDDKEKYLYNLFAVVGYPFHKGFSIYKSFICSGFVIKALTAGNVSIAGFVGIQPEDINNIISKYLFFEGNLSDYISKVNHLNLFDEYFCKDRLTQSMIKTVGVISQLSYRRIIRGANK